MINTYILGTTCTYATMHYMSICNTDRPWKSTQIIFYSWLLKFICIRIVTLTHKNVQVPESNNIRASSKHTKIILYTHVHRYNTYRYLFIQSVVGRRIRIFNDNTSHNNIIHFLSTHERIKLYFWIEYNILY